jgi:membrane-bound lytic murein transglycosylase D
LPWLDWQLSYAANSHPGQALSRVAASTRALDPMVHQANRPPSFQLSAALIGLLVVSAACVPVRREPLVPRAAPPERIEAPGRLLGTEIRPVTARLLGPVSYDLPLEANTWVESELLFLLNDRRDVLHRWMERGDYYEAFVKSVFAEYGIPTDLYHIGMIESGFIPTARSSAGAVGIWQFMPATSRDVNLRVDNVVDERMDPVRSTRAAASYLRTLYRIHGDWALAAAAYNAGTGRISRGLERYGATNFWDLARRGDLAAETQQYVPRLYAATIIARDRERFGFPLPNGVVSFAFDSIHVDLGVSLGELSEMTGVGGDDLSAMNPHLRQGATPPGGYWVWVPAGSGVQAQRSYVAASRRRSSLATYTVQWGDNLGKIAQISGVGAAQIRELNPSIDFDRLLTGAKIQLPAAGVERLAVVEPATTGSAPAPVALATVARSTAPPAGGDSRVHPVRPGDTLSEIARDYGVTVAAIQEANSLNGTVIRSGQRLTIPAAAPGAGGGGSTPVNHVVEWGDTLWEIARRYGSSVEAIQDANGLGSRPIIPGQRLEVPTTRR